MIYCMNIVLLKVYADFIDYDFVLCLLEKYNEHNIVKHCWKSDEISRLNNDI